jgi:RAB6A-GEF complex partner protein 1
MHANDWISKTHLFLPYFLQHHLANLDMPAAFSLCHHYSHLSYFPHALEILLHYVLDDEVENERKDEKQTDVLQRPPPLLPSVIFFLQNSLSINVYLDIIVQCTRKTELRSWRTLFTYLPPPKELFEQALKFKSLKTAAGYLLVLQALDDDSEGNETRIEDHAVRLFGLASLKEDWDLCGELARFLIALDASGDLLRRTIARVGLRPGQNPDSTSVDNSTIDMRGLGLSLPAPSLSSSLSPSPSSLSPRQTYCLDRKSSDISSTASGGSLDNPPNRVGDGTVGAEGST